jgi:heme/copper-type cytochrome/quinol oxidase subunit 2
MVALLLLLLLIGTVSANAIGKRDPEDPSAAFWIIVVVMGAIVLVLLGIFIYWCIRRRERQALVQGSVPDPEPGHQWGSPAAYQGVLARIKVRNQQ